MGYVKADGVRGLTCLHTHVCKQPTAEGSWKEGHTCLVFSVLTHRAARSTHTHIHGRPTRRAGSGPSPATWMSPPSSGSVPGFPSLLQLPRHGAVLLSLVKLLQTPLRSDSRCLRPPQPSLPCSASKNARVPLETMICC